MDEKNSVIFFIQNQLKLFKNINYLLFKSKSSTQIVGRMYFVHPSDHDRFALRLLLLYRKGCDSFESLRTVDGVVHNSYYDACRALGYLENDNESELTLAESITFATSSQLRYLFALILLNCLPSNPGDLWNKYKMYMADDILYKLRRIRPDAELNDEIYNVALNMINDILMKSGNHIKNYAYMPVIWTPRNLEQIYRVENLLSEELQYDHEKLNTFLQENLPKLNNEQKTVFDTIINRVNSNEDGNNVYFLDGPGGTGKTFTYKLILSKIRSENRVALAVASSGIAAQLLEGARTAHSRFKIPIVLNSHSTCNISAQSDYAKFIQQATLILWDECPMMHRHAFEALDRSLRDIMGVIDAKNRDIPFGNKLILFGGDFRQILPVVRKGGRSDIVNASFNRSKLWPNIKIMKLTVNMRIQRMSGIDQTKAQEFSDYLMKIGEGREQTYT
jgi:hypothetical protein